MVVSFKVARKYAMENGKTAVEIHTTEDGPVRGGSLAIEFDTALDDGVFGVDAVVVADFGEAP